nr:MAG TPA: hypothetical protein [Caudoviricetes sp.]
MVNGIKKPAFRVPVLVDFIVVTDYAMRQKHC